MARKGVRIIGARKIHDALVKISHLIEGTSPITIRLAADMMRFAHVDTGYMKNSIYHKRNIAGASAHYAGHEADRGGSHDYAQQAVDAFPVEKYLDEIVRPF